MIRISYWFKKIDIYTIYWIRQYKISRLFQQDTIESKNHHNHKPFFFFRMYSFQFSFDVFSRFCRSKFKEISRRVFRASTIARTENNNKNVNAARSVRVGPFVCRISFLARVEIARSDFHESWQTARLPSILYHHEDRSYHIVFLLLCINHWYFSIVLINKKKWNC